MKGRALQKEIIPYGPWRTTYHGNVTKMIKNIIILFCLGWILFMNALLMIEFSGLQRFVMVWLLPSQRCFQVLPADVLSLQVWDQFRDCTKVLLFPMCPPAGGAGGEQCCKLSILLLLLLLQFVQLGISCSTRSKSKCKSKLSLTCIAEAIFATRHNKL